MPSPDVDRVAVGSMLASRYEVLGELGRGGMATVLEVRDVRTDRRLALKILKVDVAAHPEAVERFRREGEFLQGLKHPALVAVETVGTMPDGRLFLAMERLHGETLGDRIRRGPLTPLEVSPILAGAAVGLEAAHRAGVIHRDLKPDNLFLASQSDGTMQVKLLDFGISKIDGRASLTRTGQVLGTPRYMAPEQLRGEEDLDERVDVYALGVILYESLSGTPAFPAQNPNELILSILNGKVMPLRALRPQVAAEVEAVVQRAMARAREARYGTAVELAEAWFGVVHQHDGPLGVRTGVSTSVLGSSLDSLRPPPPVAEEDLRPATFRDFEAARAPGGERAPAAAPPAMPVAPKPPARPRMGVVVESAQRPLPNAPLSPQAAGAAASPPSIPRSAVVALVAIGAIALIGIGVGLGLHFASARRAANLPGAIDTPNPVLVASPPSVASPSMSPSSMPPAESAAPMSGGASLDASAPATAPDAGRHPAPGAPVPTAAGANAHVESAGAARPSGTPAVTPQTAGNARALLAQARDAAGEGDARKCVELATEAIGAGADASAYRLRGDCYRALGDVPRALRSYQRFCSIAAPSSAQFAAVRQAAEELGGTCP